MGETVYETSDDIWQFMLDVNVRSLPNMGRAVVPYMLRAGRGKIVNLAAQLALRGGARMSAYSAAKSAVMRLTESFSAETREHGINANCILPSIIDTPENRAAMPDSDFAKWVTPAAGRESGGIPVVGFGGRTSWRGGAGRRAELTTAGRPSRIRREHNH